MLIQQKTIVCALAALAFIIAGCGEDIGIEDSSSKSPSTDSTSSTSDNKQSSQTSNNDTSEDEWVYLDEPFGDESSLEYRLTPKKVMIGEPVKIEVKTGSGYGPITEPQIMARVTAGSEQAEYGFLKDPKSGPEWDKAKMEAVFVQAYDEETDDFKELRFEPGDNKYKQYAIDNSGHATFSVTVTPTEESSVIELRWYTPKWENDKYMKGYADQGFQVYPEIKY